jgi:hypothetical protein
MEHCANEREEERESNRENIRPEGERKKRTKG